MNSREPGCSSRRVAVLRATVVAVVVGVLGLSGCAQPEDPKDDQQTQQAPESSTPTPEPTPTPTPSPTQIGYFDLAYVQAVLNYYEAYNKARTTGDTQSFLRLATGDCGSCQGMAGVIDKVFANGGHFEGGALQPVMDEDKIIARQKTDGQAFVAIRLKSKPWSIVREKGGDPEQYPATHALDQVNLVKEGDRWLIKEITSKPLDN